MLCVNQASSKDTNLSEKNRRKRAFPSWFNQSSTRFRRTPKFHNDDDDDETFNEDFLIMNPPLPDQLGILIVIS